MRLISNLLRFLLCATLALNGAAASASAIGMGMGMGGPERSAVTVGAPGPAAVDSHASMPCHDGTVAEESAMDMGAQPYPIHDTSPHADLLDTGHDCCGSAQCHCSCTISPAMAFLTFAWPMTQPVHGALIASTTAHHVPPRLMIRIRPPIA